MAADIEGYMVYTGISRDILLFNVPIKYFLYIFGTCAFIALIVIKYFLIVIILIAPLSFGIATYIKWYEQQNKLEDCADQLLENQWIFYVEDGGHWGLSQDTLVNR